MTNTVKLSIANAIVSALGLLSTIVFQRFVVNDTYGGTLVILGYASLIVSTIDIGNDAKFLGQKRSIKWNESQVFLMFIRGVFMIILLFLIGVFVELSFYSFMFLCLISFTGYITRLVSFSGLYDGNVKLYFTAVLANVLIKAIAFILIATNSQIYMIILLLLIVSIYFFVYLRSGIDINLKRVSLKNLYERSDLGYLFYGATLVVLVRGEVLIIPKFFLEFDYAVFLSLNNLAMAVPIIITNSIFLTGLVSDDETSSLHKNKLFVVIVIFVVAILVFLSKYFILALYGSEWLPYHFILSVLFIAYVGGVIFARLEPFFIRKQFKEVVIARIFQTVFHYVLITTVCVLKMELIYLGLSALLNRVFIWIYYTIAYERFIAREN